MSRLLSCLFVLSWSTVSAAETRWVVSWTGSAHGPYPSGNPLAQPTGRLRPELAHNTSVGGPADWVHPNRLGYLAMAMAADLALFEIPTTATDPR